jgi:hypothetical protein
MIRPLTGHSFPDNLRAALEAKQRGKKQQYIISSSERNLLGGLMSTLRSFPDKL